ncbi:hypothetical protein Pmani_019206 [Petrolisthes manimaculis]|uniref:Mevalonate kinase n=1 Tax=Petrolisthes manimaculis TaxID=1843537 RepID=A0AAE1PIS0_9EUCA|nr:hypothetical protein Pmani_019206 [Petrolisthes manimaculis]
MKPDNCDGVIRVSAPGKVILHGEHSVVYGKRAVALSLDLRTHLTLTPGGDIVSLDLPDLEIKESWGVDTLRVLVAQLGRKQEQQSIPLSETDTLELCKFLNLPQDTNSPKKLALLSFLHLYMSILPHPVGLNISLTSQLPTGAGVGSSAAYGVCISASLLRFTKMLESDVFIPKPDDNLDDTQLKEVSSWAFRSEQIVHGTPSGIDNSVCTYGGAVNFKGGDISPLAIPPLQILLVNTKVSRSTKALVAGVRERRERLPSVIDPVLDALDALADRAVEVLHQIGSATDSTNIDAAFRIQQELVDMNQALLCALGVSHPSLDRLVGIAQSHGLHAKLTGAGGGGFGLVVVGKETVEGEAVVSCRKELEDASYQVWTTSLGSPGITFH